MQLNWAATAIKVYASSKRVSPDMEPDTRCRQSPGGSGRCIPARCSRRRRRRRGEVHAAETRRRLPRRQQRAAAVGDPGHQCRHRRRGHLRPPRLNQHRRCADHRRHNDRHRRAGAAEQRGEAAVGGDVGVGEAERPHKRGNDRRRDRDGHGAEVPDLSGEGGGEGA